MVNIRGIFLVALMLSGVMPLSATTLNQFLSSGYPKAGMGVPYGYNSSSMGAGDQSFQWCLDLVSTNMVKPSVTAPAARRRPLVIICGKDSCGACSAFADMVNKNPRGMPTWFGRLKITTAYFRGTKPACEKARAFIKGHQVGGGGDKVGFKESESVDPCHRVYVYGVYENGDRYFGTIGSIPMTPDTYGTAIAAQIKRFDNDYDNHLYKPPAANAEFTVEDGWLEATPETEQVYVPFSRMNDITRVETNRLVATFSDQSAVTNDIPWTLSSANMEVAVERPATGWGDVGARIRLELLSTNGVSVATNFITCVAATNSLLLPSRATPDAPGVWTLLEGAATNQLPAAVATANGHFVTNDTPTSISHEVQASFDVTNRLTVVTTNDLSAFPSFDAVAWTELTNLVARSSVYVDAGNTLCATNGFSAWTNAVAKGGDTLRPQTRTVALNTVTITNFVAGEEALKPVETFPATTMIEATNELSGVFATLGTTHAVAFPFTVTVALPATNVVSALADGEHPADTASTNATPVAFSITVLTTSRTLEAVRVGSEAVRDPDNGDVPVEQRHEQVWTDPAFTTNLVDGTTVAYTAKDDQQTNVVACTVTNTTYCIFGNENGTASTMNDPDVVRCPFTYTLTTNYYGITRDQYTGGDIRAFQLRVTGGLVWDERVRTLAKVFDSGEFKEWCAASNVVCTVIDQRDETGASLFTHKKAAKNGIRGTSFLSRNGLQEDKGRSPEGNTFKVELIRPNGTTENGENVYENGVQAVTNQVVWATTDPTRFDTVDDARATLNSALDLARTDPTEGLNDDPATTPLTLAFNTVTNQTLSALDTVDVFKLTGAYRDKAVAFTLTNKTDTADVLSFSVCDEAGMEIPPTFDAAESTNRVWVFKADDAVFVKVFTTNALPGTVAYGVGATNAPPCPGTVGFKVTEAEVEEGVVTNVADNAFAFLHTKGTINYFGLAVRRTGYTGAASCTISLDEDAIPEDMREDVRKRIVWENQKLTWNDLECGETNVVIGLVNDKDWYADVKLTFNLEVVSGDGVEVREGDGSFTLTYKDNDPMDPGKLAIDKENMTGKAFRAAGDGKFYARAGSLLDIPVNRNVASCSSVTGRLVVATSGVGVEITDPDSGADISETGSVWNDRESDPKTFRVELPKEVKPGSKGHQEIKLELKGDHVDSKSNSVTICVLPANAPGWNDTSPDGECSPDEKTTWTGVQYTKFEDSVELAGDGDLVSHKPERISGAVPAGLTVTLDKVTRQLVVSGIPTAPTPTNGVTLVYWAKATVGGKTVWTLPVTLHITIRALADVNANFAGDGAKSKTVWTGLALLDKTAVDAGEPARLRGLLDLTVSPKGRTSAKWRTVEGKTVSFSAAGFAGIDEASGDVGLAATRVVAGVTNTLTATLFAAGKMEATIASNDVEVAFGTVEADAAAWSKDHPATDYVGTYVAAFPVDTNWVETVAGGTSPLCSGAATLTFRLAAGAARTGRTTFAGVLPNGRTFSGSATLAGNAALPVLAASATDAFASVLDIARGGEVAAAEGTEPFWAHRERNFASLSCAPALICVGARWTAPDKDAELPLDVQAPGEDGEVVASTRLRLNRTSGVVQGALRVRNAETGRLETRTARGVLVPRGEEGFALFGACWWNEVLDAERDDGTTVRKTVRVGDSLGE